MIYEGEHLLPGQFGHFFLVLSLVSSLVATVSYAFAASVQLPDDVMAWKRLARWAFVVDVVSVVAIFGLIFWIISQHYFEYFYVWNHSDRSLDSKYLLSSIWEGQEGSFLLWAFWQGVLGILLMRKAGRWEAPVMTVISFAQVCLATFIMGVYVFGTKVGSNPFILTRLSFQDLPVFQRADYLSLPRFQDGNGLNQLLQNYWMVIHPPILFLGFASTIIPFAFVISALWKKDYSGWTKLSLPWCLFSAGTLGLGIMMGAKWAYESLNFGGYWAWDPVENASLVPWLLLVAGIHTQVIFNATGHSLRPTLFYYLGAFLLVLYSTYLTRSGDLQETSVHAFTDQGMNWHLRVFVLLFLVPSVAGYIARYTRIPHPTQEEPTWTREFWMYIGSIVLFLAAMAIIVPTSFPIFNKVFHTNWAIGSDQEFAYNRVQIFVAILVGLLTAVSQFFNYKHTQLAVWGRHLFISLIASLLILIGVVLTKGITYDKYGIGFLVAIDLALWASVFSVLANGQYILSRLKGKLKAAGGAIAHVGFALFLVGVLLSSAKKEVLSVNRFNPVNFGADNKERGEENLTLFRGIRNDMGDYWATYVKDSVVDKNKYVYFQIRLDRKDGKESFDLYPDLIKNSKGQQGYSNNPDARHYLHKDIFSYISYADHMMEGEDTTQFKNTVISLKDTLFYSRGYLVLDTVGLNLPNQRRQFGLNDTAVVARLRVIPLNGTPQVVEPYLQVRGSTLEQVADTLVAKSLAVRFTRITSDRRFELGIRESSRLTPFVTLKVLSFPYINLVWLGILIMLTGFVLSAIRRSKLL